MPNTSTEARRRRQVGGFKKEKSLKERRKKVYGKLFNEIMTQKSSNLAKDIILQI